MFQPNGLQSNKIKHATAGEGGGGGVNRVNAYSISLLHDKLYLHVFYIRFDSLGPLENKEKRAHYHE